MLIPYAYEVPQFKATPPFSITWIRIADTEPYIFDKIKNALNEGLPVFIGRDGQEMEEQAGQKVCDLIDRDVGRHD